MSQNPKTSMKRFYKDADFIAVDTGFQIRLDTRPVRTPNRAPLVVEGERLAWAIVAEWLAQGKEEGAEDIDPASMPMTGLANAAIDRVGPERDVFIADIANYATSDLLCYRAEGPEPLVARQAAAWDGMLDWAKARYAAPLILAAGVMPVAQPEHSLANLRTAVAAMSAWQLAAMARIVNLSGTLVGALALHEGAVDADTLWAASILDELWQAELWGEDHWADKHRADRERDFRAAVRFLTLVQ